MNNSKDHSNLQNSANAKTRLQNVHDLLNEYERDEATRVSLGSSNLQRALDGGAILNDLKPSFKKEKIWVATLRQEFGKGVRRLYDWMLLAGIREQVDAWRKEDPGLTVDDALKRAQGEEPKQPLTEEQQNRKDVENISKKVHVGTCAFDDPKKWTPELINLLHTPFKYREGRLFERWEEHQGRVAQEFYAEVKQEQLRLKEEQKASTGEQIDNAASRLSIDSGAFSLFNDHAKDGDYSYFDLSKGTEFRAYCDAYALFMKELRGSGVWCANVDAIYNPELTWKIQQFLEKEHGITPVPVVHWNTPMKDVDRYLGYPLLGVGGMANVSTQEFRPWGDTLFAHLKKENPSIKTHGFACTRVALMTQYKFTSVDSATWAKYAGDGGIYIPRFSEKDAWRFNEEPMKVHYHEIPKEVPRTVSRWLEHCGTNVQSIYSDYRARYLVNLIYFSELAKTTGVNVYFSGGSGKEGVPETLIKDRNPHIMLTFHDLRKGEAGSRERFKRLRKKAMQKLH